MKRAFTLVEMLVAIVLLSLLIGVAVFSFRLQLISIHKIKTQSLNKVLRFNQIKSTIQSTKYYVVQQYDMLNLPMSQLDYFYQGTAKEIRFITTNPIFTQEDALVMFMCKDNMLLYKEEPLFAKINFLRPDFRPQSRELVLYKNIKNCNFSYLVQKNRYLQNISKVIPLAVKISYILEDSKKTIFAKIRSDNNTTKAIIEETMFNENL